MAGKVYVAEYADLKPIDSGRWLPVGHEPCVAEQALVTGGTTAQLASPFNAKTKFIRVHAATIVSIAIGANPTATTSTKRMAAGATEYFSVEPGHTLAAIDNT